MPEQFALFPLESIPKASRTAVQEMRIMEEVIQEKGVLLPTGLAAEVLDIGKTRMFQLIDDGIIEVYEFFGKKWIAQQDILYRLANKPKGGRPKKLQED